MNIPPAILLVEDHPIVRLGLTTLLRNLGQFLELYEAENEDQALAAATAHAPAIALLDLSLAGMLKLGTIGRLRAAAPSMSVIVVSMHDERLYAERALRAGARGYVMKQSAARCIVEAIRTVAAGRIWVSEAMRDRMLEKLSERKDTGGMERLNCLSDRELEVFRLIGHGFKKAGIASQLNLSPNTVETHRLHIKHKLGLATGAELHRMAFLLFQDENAAHGN